MSEKVDKRGETWNVVLCEAEATQANFFKETGDEAVKEVCQTPN